MSWNLNQIPPMETGRGYKNIQAELLKFYDMVKKFWKQKAGMQWFQNGE